MIHYNLTDAELWQWEQEEKETMEALLQQGNRSDLTPEEEAELVRQFNAANHSYQKAIQVQNAVIEQTKKSKGLR